MGSYPVKLLKKGEAVNGKVGEGQVVDLLQRVFAGELRGYGVEECHVVQTLKIPLPHLRRSAAERWRYPQDPVCCLGLPRIEGHVGAPSCPAVLELKCTKTVEIVLNSGEIYMLESNTKITYKSERNSGVFDPRANN